MIPKSESLSKILFFSSGIFLIFLCGMFVAYNYYFPYRYVRKAFRQLDSLIDDRYRIPYHLSKVRYHKTGAKIYDHDSLAPGVTLLTSHWPEFDWKPGIRLIDAEGNILHQWRTDPAEIWPKSPHKDYRAGLKNDSRNYVHGTYLFKNGDVLFNIEYLGLVRMNAHNDIIWRLPYRTHHSIFRAESGDFWVCGLKWIEKNTPEGKKRLELYPGLNPPIAEEFAIRVSPDGEILQEISLLEALFKSGYGYLFWQIGYKRIGDVTHLNKIEMLHSNIAHQYSLFKAGDLVISLRDINTVLVLDPSIGMVKWLTTESFIKQHDPKFIGNGWIAIFDNNFDGSDNGGHLGGSRIVAVKPDTDEFRVLYPTKPSQSFYTKRGGKFQILENGNLLITEARAGRIFEVEPSGRLVWEWLHEHYENDWVPEVLEGTRYKLTPAEISSWKKE